MAITCKTGDRIEERVPRCPSGRAVEDLIVGPLSWTPPVGDAIVDDHDLAMVPEVDAALERTQQGVAYGQARQPRASPAGMLGADDRARAKVIGHGPTGHAAGDRALQGLDDLAAVVVWQPDVEQHMDVIRCGIDVGHHRVDRGVGVDFS